MSSISLLAHGPVVLRYPSLPTFPQTVRGRLVVFFSALSTGANNEELNKTAPFFQPLSVAIPPPDSFGR